MNEKKTSDFVWAHQIVANKPPLQVILSDTIKPPLNDEPTSQTPFDKYCSSYNHPPRPHSPHLTVFLGGSWLVEHGEEQQSSPRSEVLHDSRSSRGDERRARCCRCASAFKSPSRWDGAQSAAAAQDPCDGKTGIKRSWKTQFPRARRQEGEVGVV